MSDDIVVNLATKRRPVVYTAEITHGFDGALGVKVRGASDDDRSRASVAWGLREAADLLDPQTEDPRLGSSHDNLAGILTGQAVKRWHLIAGAAFIFEWWLADHVSIALDWLR